MTQRQAAKHFNISRDSVAKMVAYSTPPGYQRRSPIRRPKLDAFVSTIEHCLDEDLKMPRKQRHTARRVFDRLRDECGFTGGYTTIKDYIGLVGPKLRFWPSQRTDRERLIYKVSELAP